MPDRGLTASGARGPMTCQKSVRRLIPRDGLQVAAGHKMPVRSEESPIRVSLEGSFDRWRTQQAAQAFLTRQHSKTPQMGNWRQRSSGTVARAGLANDIRLGPTSDASSPLMVQERASIISSAVSMVSSSSSTDTIAVPGWKREPLVLARPPGRRSNDEAARLFARATPCL